MPTLGLQAEVLQRRMENGQPYILGVIEEYDDVSSYGKKENPCLD